MYFHLHALWSVRTDHEFHSGRLCIDVNQLPLLIVEAFVDQITSEISHRFNDEGTVTATIYEVIPMYPIGIQLSQFSLN